MPRSTPIRKSRQRAAGFAATGNMIPFTRPVEGHESTSRTDRVGQDPRYEINIFDTHAEWPTGSINNTKSVLPNKPDTTEKWNALEITGDGNHLIVKVNGAMTVDVQDERRSTGTIALQEGGANASGLIRFRNVKVRAF